MATLKPYFYFVTLVLYALFCQSSADRRFSDLKRCADEECSMLLGRGRAAKDFTGPDCRFLTFKKGETIYVYYKLSGQRSDMWAGSVGNHFGYFPKDYLTINHIYTEKEIEVPADETDFVCFDTGFDKFESYDIDVLLGNSLLIENERLTEESKEPSQNEAVLSQMPSETETASFELDSESTSLHETESVQSVSIAPLKTESLDSESTSPLETKTLELQSTTLLETESLDSETTLPLETKSLESESTSILETESLDSESTSPLETESLDSESTSPLETESLDSETTSPLETKSLESESTSILETESLDSESTSPLETESLDSQSTSPLETKTLDSQSTSPLETKSLELESTTLLETESLDSESTSPLETESVDSESTSLLETESLDSETTLPLETKSVDSESTSLLETDTVGSIPVESPEKALLLSKSEESDSFQPKIEDISSETTLKLKDAVKEVPEPKAAQLVPGMQADILLNNDAVALQDVKTEPSDSSELLLNQSNSERQSGTEEVTDVETLEPMKTEAQTAGSEVDNEESAKTEEKTLPTAVKTLEEATEDNNVWSPFKDVSKAERKDVTQETKSLEGVTRDKDKIMEDLPKKSHLKDLASPVNLHTISDSEEQAIAEDITDGKILEPSQLPPDTKTLDATRDSSDTQPKSQDISSEPPVEKHIEQATESENTFLSLNADRTLANGSVEDDLKEEDTNKTEAANENSEDLDRVNMNTNENANKNIDQDNDPQNAVTNMGKKADESIEELDPKKSITNQSEELLEDAVVLEGPETVSLPNETDDQINKVKNELTDLLKNTLESEQQSPEDEEEPLDQEEKEEAEELLEDENALFSSSKSLLTEDEHEAEDNQQPEVQGESDAQSDNSTEADEVPSSPFTNITQEEEDNEMQDKDGSKNKHEIPLPHEEPVYSDNVIRLTLLRDHLKDEDMERMQKYLGLKNLFKLEAMFSDLDQEMMSVKVSQTSTEDIESTLDQIMEASENSILDETEEMLNERERKAQEHGQKKETEMYDMEAAILDSFQEIVFSLRQKYSAAKDSIPLLEEEQPAFETEEQYDSEVVKDLVSDAETIKPPESSKIQEENNESELILNSELNVNAQDLSHSQDMGLEEDGGHFNRNKDAQIGFEDAEEIQKGPHAILENPVDIGFHFEMDPSSAGSLEAPSVSDFHDTETNTDTSSSTSDELWNLLLLVKEYLGVYAEVLITALPEEWRPGPTFHGVPWEPVMATAAVGLLTVLMFFWRIVLAIKGRTYQLTEKQLTNKIQQLLSEKSDAVKKISELNDTIKEREEQLKSSKKTLSSSQQEMTHLKTHHKKLQSQCEEMSGSISQLNLKIADTQKENSNLNEKILKMHQRIEKYQKTLKNFDEERAKVHVLMDEAKFREDALKAQVNCFEKENGALKEQKKSFLRDAKDWQEKHEKLSEEIRVYHKAQKELEDSLVHKENEIDVLSSCIAELNRLAACDAAEQQKEDAKLPYGEESEKKIDTMRQHIRQMTDVSRIKATLSIVEDERNRYMESLLTEQKSRQELEEQYQKVMHDQMNLKNEKTHLENQFKTLQQRLEITTELYQQKESALQQKLTQEELERREKEMKLSEVDSKAVMSEEELRALKQKIRDIEEEMQQNEQALRNEVAVQEKKAHENWLKARASERALVEERRESATLRQKLVECSDKISDMEQTLFKLNSGAPDRHVMPMRRGDSYGPSPVSGGAPSPPLMIEGPGRPPSAPVGRRNESFGPRPPSDPHGRFSDLGHPLPSRPEMFPPMTSSPCAHDGPMQTAPVVEKAEASEQVSSEPVEPLPKSQGQGSFLPSPIRDSPVPPQNAPLKSYGPQMMGGPVPPNGPPPLMIRPPNGHHPLMPAGPPLGPEPRFRPHMDSYGPPPPIGPFGPVPFGRGPPLRDFPPMGRLPPPLFGQRDIPPDFYGPRGLPPRPFPPGPLPIPGSMPPPPYASRGFPGPVPLVPQSSRDGEENASPPTDDRPQLGAEQDASGSSMAEP